MMNLKKIIKAISIALVMLLSLQSSTIAFAQIKEKSPYTAHTYTHQSRFDERPRLNGVDISQHNNTVNFKKVKAAGIDFAFIRVGYTGYTKSRFSLNYDTHYKTNITKALDAGLAVGVYWYSQALNTTEAKQEAQKLIAAIQNYNITLPVVMDYEFAGTSAGRLDSAKLSKNTMTNNALAFLSELSKAGYDGCLYANKSFLETHLNASQISDDYKIWLAHYTTNTPYAGEFDFWQYTESGKVNGIEGKADVNFWYYEDHSVELNSYIYTGQAIEPKPVIKDGEKILVENEDYTLSYSNNTNVGTARITATGINDYKGKKYNFKFLIKPDRTPSLTLKSRSTDTLSFTWNAVKGAQTYYVYIKNNFTGKGFSKKVSTNSITITGLTPGNEYNVSVKCGRKSSSGKIIYGSYSAINTKHTIADAVTGLKSTGRSNTSVSLQWNKKQGAAGYRVYRYSPSSKKYSLVTDLSGYNSNKYTVKNLKVGETVYFSVAAYTKDSEKKIGTKSPKVADTTRPQPIKTRKTSSPSSKKISMLWYRVNCTGYQIQWSTSKDFKSNVQSARFKQNTNKATLSTKSAKKTYYLRIRSYKTFNGKNIYSTWSNVQRIKVK